MCSRFQEEDLSFCLQSTHQTVGGSGNQGPRGPTCGNRHTRARLPEALHIVKPIRGAESDKKENFQANGEKSPHDENLHDTYIFFHYEDENFFFLKCESKPVLKRVRCLRNSVESMIKDQSRILIFEASGVICPGNSICMYPINQESGVRGRLPMQPLPLPQSYYSGEGLAWPSPTGKSEEAQVVLLVVDLFKQSGAVLFHSGERGDHNEQVAATVGRVWPWGCQGPQPQFRIAHIPHTCTMCTYVTQRTQQHTHVQAHTTPRHIHVCVHPTRHTHAHRHTRPMGHTYTAYPLRYHRNHYLRHGGIGPCLDALLCRKTKRPRGTLAILMR